MNYNSKNIDVVIPTLKGKRLYKTIQSLNIGTIKPKNIICVYFYKFNFSIYKKKFKNVKFIKGKIKNQVQQRLQGFKHVKSNFILQLDDDIILKKNTLSLLLKYKLKMGQKSIVGPTYLNLKKKPLHNLENNYNFFSNIYKCLICDAKYGVEKIGTVTSIGLAYGVNSQTNKNILKCQWLPGGCILFSKNLLKIKFDKIFFKNKSYCEDIFFSIQRNIKKFSHYTAIKSIVYTDINYEKLSFNFFIDEMIVRRNLLKYTRGNIMRFYLWSVLEFLNRFILKRLFSNN